MAVLSLIAAFVTVGASEAMDSEASASGIRDTEIDAQGELHVREAQRKRLLRSERQMAEEFYADGRVALINRHGLGGCSDDECSDTHCCNNALAKCWRWQPQQTMVCRKAPCGDGEDNCNDITMFTENKAPCAPGGNDCSASRCCQDVEEKCIAFGPRHLTQCKEWNSCEKPGCEDLTAQPVHQLEGTDEESETNEEVGVDPVDVAPHRANVNEPQHFRPDFVFGGQDERVCPGGSVVIEEEVGCQGAAKGLSLEYSGTVTSALVPKGCFLAWPYETLATQHSYVGFSGKAAYNLGDGGIGEKGRPICKSVDGKVSA